MSARAGLGAAWLGVVALLVLVTRWLCYALAPPSLLTTQFEHSAGGPRFVVIALVSLALAVGMSTAALWLVAIGVRERQRLQADRALPRLRPRRLAVRGVGLFATSSLAFAGFESYLHWRAGLGFHGLSCLLGPVHRNAIPLLAAFSLLAATLAEAASHLWAWARAAVRELLRPRLGATGRVPILLPSFRRRPVVVALPRCSRPRAPPIPA
jgi:hypothetical protein